MYVCVLGILFDALIFNPVLTMNSSALSHSSPSNPAASGLKDVLL